MRKIDSLQKVQKLLKNQEAMLFKKCALSKKKIDDEIKTFEFLKNCLGEYREKLKRQGEESICAYQYQRFCRFIAQLENASSQQALTIQRLNDSHQYLMIEYDVLKNKITQIEKLIENELKAIVYINNRKDNQAATDLFNHLKPK